MGYNHPTLTQMIRDREELILSEQTGLTVEQVHTLNNLEATEAHVESNGKLYAEFYDGNDHPWHVVVREDGSIDYTAGGAFPELAKWNQ